MQPSTKLLGTRLIQRNKVTGYLLNSGHPEGSGKAKFFVAHGFETLIPDALSSAIHAHAEINDVCETTASPYGTKRTVRCSIPTPDGRNPCILAVWIQENGQTEQRLVTAYPFNDRLSPKV